MTDSEKLDRCKSCRFYVEDPNIIKGFCCSFEHYKNIHNDECDGYENFETCMNNLKATLKSLNIDIDI